MADVLLNDHTRVLLSRVLESKHCPTDLDQHTFRALQRGDRFTVSLRNLAALVAAQPDVDRWFAGDFESRRCLPADRPRSAATTHCLYVGSMQYSAINIGNEVDGIVAES